MKATTRDLRLHTSELLSATDRGETVIITYRGKRRAVLSGWHSGTKETGTPGATRSTGRNPAFGIWKDRDDDVAEQVRKLRARRDLP